MYFAHVICAIAEAKTGPTDQPGQRRRLWPQREPGGAFDRRCGALMMFERPECAQRFRLGFFDPAKGVGVHAFIGGLRTLAAAYDGQVAADGQDRCELLHTNAKI